MNVILIYFRKIESFENVFMGSPDLIAEAILARQRRTINDDHQVLFAFVSRFPNSELFFAAGRDDAEELRKNIVPVSSCQVVIFFKAGIHVNGSER